jgi:iron(III) transport system substrate-binding protein
MPTLSRLLILVALLVAACAPRAAAPAAAPPAAQVPSEWDQVVAAAKQEGSVSVIGPTGDDRRAVLTEPFEKQYGITVDFLADNGPGVPPRLSSERGAGLYLWDLFVGGTTTGLESLIPMGVLDSMDGAFILPEVKDPAVWRGGGPEFVDDGHTMLVMTPFQRGTLFINPNLVRPDEITSYKDLLDPKWKGKLVIDDPRKAGAGQATFTFFYRHPDLGPEFIRALARQEPLILRDYLQQLDGVGQGRYPLVIGSSDALAEQRMKSGVPIAIVDARQIKEGTDVSPASGAVALFNRPPHPNAARVYLNWLLSREEQTEFARATSYISSRLDVPTDHTFPWRVPVPGAVKTYDQLGMDTKYELQPLLAELFGR